MVESGATLTWEAWDQTYKRNQDWNHAWGAAPANLLPRKVLGVEPLSPGYAQIQIAPRPGTLTAASGKIPTPKGPVLVAFSTAPDFNLTVEIPPQMTARVSLPLSSDLESRNARLLCNGQPHPATAQGNRLVSDQLLGSGHYEIKLIR
jgi:hypothetical protein